MAIAIVAKGKGTFGATVGIRQGIDFTPVVGRQYITTRSGELVPNDYVSVEPPQDPEVPQSAPDYPSADVMFVGFLKDVGIRRDEDGDLLTPLRGTIVPADGHAILVDQDSFTEDIASLRGGAGLIVETNGQFTQSQDQNEKLAGSIYLAGGGLGLAGINYKSARERNLGDYAPAL